MLRKFSILLLAALVTACVGPAGATDDVLAEARRLAGSGHRGRALALLSKHLAAHPADMDARLLYGTTLSWEGRYPEARTELDKVLAATPDYTDAWLALIHVEMWSGHPGRAEELARLGLERQPDNHDLLAMRARSLRSLGRARESVGVLDRLLAIDPGNRDARRDRDLAFDAIYPWTVRFEQSHEWFNNSAAPWHEYQLELKRGTAMGPVLLRLSRADRFEKHGNQAEVDWYPQLRRGTYGYINVGYSYDAALYPRTRAGFELYQALPWATEVSSGYRRLGFDDSLNIYTWSLGKYHGNWWLNGRVYVSPGTAGSSVSVQASVRRYFGRPGDYWGIVVGRGSSPAGISNVTDLGILNSTSGYFEIQKIVARHWVFGFRGGTAREDRLGLPPANRYLLDVSVAVRF